MIINGGAYAWMTPANVGVGKSGLQIAATVITFAVFVFK